MEGSPLRCQEVVAGSQPKTFLSILTGKGIGLEESKSEKGRRWGREQGG